MMAMDELHSRCAAFDAYGDAELLMLSQEDASRMIAQLESELRNHDLTKFPTPRYTEDDVNAIRDLNTVDKAEEREVEKLNNIVYSLMSVLGQRADDWEHEEARLIVERWDLRDRDTQVQWLIQKLYDFMVYLLDNDFITDEGLDQIVADYPIA